LLIGFAISSGQIWGGYLVLASTATLQFFISYKLLGKLRLTKPSAITMAAIVAFHPWWPAGYTLRFLSAQLATLLFLVFLYCAVQFFTGRARPLAFLAGSIFAYGLLLLTYQAHGLSAVLVSAVFVLFFREVALRKRVILFSSLVATLIAITGVWTLLIAPRVGNSYELALAGSQPNPALMIANLFNTLLAYHGVTALLALIIALLLFLARSRNQQHATLDTPKTQVLILGLVMSPLVALTYLSPLHLNDPERVLLPFGVYVWTLTALFLSVRNSQGEDPLFIGLAALVSTAAIGLTINSVMYWSEMSATQQETVSAISTMPELANSDKVLLVADHSGVLGDVYTLLPPHLDIALSVVVPSKKSEVILCTLDEATRQHLVANRYPIATTPSCSEFVHKGATPFSTKTLSFGTVSLYQISQADVDQTR
jgi:hypothetical protein